MVQDHRATEEQNTRRRAGLLRVRYFDTRELHQKPIFQGVFTNDEMYRLKAVVLTMEEGKMIIAITAETPQTGLRDIKQKFSDYSITFVMISPSGFKEFMAIYDPPKKVEYEDIELRNEDMSGDVANISQTLEGVRSDDVFNYLIRQARRLGASDVHLEMQEYGLRIRLRVDGVLHEIARISEDKYRQLSSTIAVNANISTSSPDAQTGHMHYKILDDDKSVFDEVDMRIETVPTNFGQDAVIRLFNINKELLQLERLGLSKSEKEIIDEIVARPTGLVMSVGPTGSGKTTTLYSIINKLNTPDKKIITLEDPVEYTLPGIVQIPVNTEKTDSFSDKLRAVLRLDPDVVMIGEIRDADTAKTALQASLSGHLVLSTFHAADTLSAITRLYGLLGDNPMLTSAIRLIVAQRLVRKLDEKSKKKFDADERMLGAVKRAFEDYEDNEKPDIDKTEFFEPGSSKEAPFGYVGQTAVVELLNMSDELETVLHASDGDLDNKKLREVAIKNGMITLEQNAYLKAIHGETSLQEVFRVIG